MNALGGASIDDLDASVIDVGDWIEIEWTVLEAAERTGRLPVDTAALPYRARCRGAAAERTSIGRETRIVTPAGRELAGRVVARFPGHDHSFGRPILAWLAMRDAIRELRA